MIPQPFTASALHDAARLAFPSLALGLAFFLLAAETLWRTTGDGAFRALYAFWAPIFGVCLLTGAAAVISASDARGWSSSAELLGAALLAAGAPGLAVVFARRRVGQAAHMAATLATTAVLTATLVWIAGQSAGPAAAAADVAGRAARDGATAILATCLVVAGVSGWRLLRRPDEAASIIGLRLALGALAVIGAFELLTQAWAGLGLLVAALSVWAAWLCWRRGGPERSGAFLGACLGMGLLGVFAAGAGWTASQAVGGFATGGSTWLLDLVLALLGGGISLRLAARGISPAAEPGRRE